MSTTLTLKLALAEKPPYQYHRASELLESKLYCDIECPPPQWTDGMHTIVITSCIHAKESSTVYSGHFESQSNTAGRAVVLKFGDLQKLCTEANYYSTMEDLQGTSIPRLVGFLFGEKKDDTHYGCLITEKSGEALRVPGFLFLSASEKATILNHLHRIHNYGFVHNDFEPRNVVQQGHEFRIIDFGDMETSHLCTMPEGEFYDFNNMTDNYFERPDELCPTLSLAAWNAGFFDHGTVPVFGNRYPKAGLPSEWAMEQLFPRFWLDKYVTRSLGFADLLQFFFTHIYDNAKGKTTSEIIDEYKDRIPQVAEEVERVYPGEFPPLRVSRFDTWVPLDSQNEVATPA